MTLIEPDGDLDCRTPTRSVDADIAVDGGRSLPVTLYLATVSETHSGPETMAESLSRRRQFLPARLRETGETFLVRRSAIRTLTVALDAAEDLHPPETAGFVDLVRLELDGGECVEGTIATVLPPGKDRLSDYFNEPESQFVALAVPDGVTYVNRDFIAVVWL